MSADDLNNPKNEFLSRVGAFLNDNPAYAALDVARSALESVELGRRDVLKAGGIVSAAVALWSPRDAFAVTKRDFAVGRELTLRNVHTGEKFKGEYWADGRYLPDAFRDIKKIMRDHRSGEVFPVDPRLMDILFVLQNRMDNFKPFEVYSGYRSPTSNAKLRRVSRGVAKHSLHMQGQAIDIKLPGSSLSALRRQAIALKAGGVGYYPSSSFVHIDTGRVRHW